MKEIEYQQKMCASAGQIPPLQEQTAKAGKQRGLVPVLLHKRVGRFDSQ
jgi:hypothetical protein